MSQEKSKTMPMDIFGGLKRCIMGFVKMVNVRSYLLKKFSGVPKVVTTDSAHENAHSGLTLLFTPSPAA